MRRTYASVRAHHHQARRRSLPCVQAARRRRGTTFAQEVEDALRADLQDRRIAGDDEPFEVPVFEGDDSRALIDINDNRALQDLMDDESESGDPLRRQRPPQRPPLGTGRSPRRSGAARNRRQRAGTLRPLRVVLGAFVRIATNPRAFSQPTPLDDAFRFTARLLDAPTPASSVRGNAIGRSSKTSAAALKRAAP